MLIRFCREPPPRNTVIKKYTSSVLLPILTTGSKVGEDHANDEGDPLLYD